MIDMIDIWIYIQLTVITIKDTQGIFVTRVLNLNNLIMYDPELLRERITFVTALLAEIQTLQPSWASKVSSWIGAKVKHFFNG